MLHVHFFYHVYLCNKYFVSLLHFQIGCEFYHDNHTNHFLIIKCRSSLLTQLILIVSSLRCSSRYINKQLASIFISNLSLFPKMYNFISYTFEYSYSHIQNSSAEFQSSSPSRTCSVSIITRYIYGIFFGASLSKNFSSNV